MIKGVFFISLKIDILWECFPLDYQCPFSVCFRLLQSRYLVQRWNLIPYPNCTYIVYIPRWRKLISTWKVVICVSLNYNWFEHDLLHTQSVQEIGHNIVVNVDWSHIALSIRMRHSVGHILSIVLKISSRKCFNAHMFICTRYTAVVVVYYMTLSPEILHQIM